MSDPGAPYRHPTRRGSLWEDAGLAVSIEAGLIALAAGLGAGTVAGWSAEEAAPAAEAGGVAIPQDRLSLFRKVIWAAGS